MAVENTSYVKVHYKGTLSDGSVFDSSIERDQPLELILGQGMLIPGFEEGLVGMSAGDKKTVNIPSDKAYGPRREEMVQQVPKDKLPPEAQVGMQLVAQGPQGALPVTILEITETEAKLDFNHPLAGQDLTFELEVLDERAPTEDDTQKILGGHSHDDHEHGDDCCGGHCKTGESKDGECCKTADADESDSQPEKKEE